MSKYKVPEGMLKTFVESHSEASKQCVSVDLWRVGLEGALRWLAENPIVPTSKQMERINTIWHQEGHLGKGTGYTTFWLIEWQRSMFLESEPEARELSS